MYFYSFEEKANGWIQQDQNDIFFIISAEMINAESAQFTWSS